MRYVALKLLMFGMAPCVAAADDAKTFPAGIYDNISMSAETLDLGGMAVEYKPGSSPRVVVTTCEGGCYGGASWPAVVDGSRISFTVCDTFVDRNGKPVQCNPVAYTGVFETKARLIVTAAGRPEFREVLSHAPNAPPGYVERLACPQGDC